MRQCEVYDRINFWPYVRRCDQPVTAIVDVPTGMRNPEYAWEPFEVCDTHAKEAIAVGARLVKADIPPQTT